MGPTLATQAAREGAADDGPAIAVGDGRRAEGGGEVAQGRPPVGCR
ncbi:MAG: hypothetical protein AAF962_00845 [Actinomycetota bacterium]